MSPAAIEKKIRESWDGLADRAKFGSRGNQTLTRLIEAYQSPQRHYHNLSHIHECLEHARMLPSDAPFEIAVLTAIWFHDIVYDPQHHDNESKSAEWAAVELRSLGCEEAFIKSVDELILDTRHTQLPLAESGRYMVDIDLAILGAAPDRFDEYERDIRREYAHVSDTDFRSGRAVILKRFIARDAIYLTLPFRERYESQARTNLQRSLHKLTGESKLS
jgi:predicted metal-dependent HD superfamily phosphohydrolase